MKKAYIYVYKYSLTRNSNFCKNEKTGPLGGTHLENTASCVHLVDT